jgi:hypothetical protein
MRKMNNVMSVNQQKMDDVNEKVEAETKSGQQETTGTVRVREETLRQQ